MSAALQLVKPVPCQPSPKVMTGSAIAHLASLNAVTRRLRQWRIKIEKIDPYSNRWQCPVITIRRNPDETLRPLLDASERAEWVGKVCFSRLSGCLITWTES